MVPVVWHIVISNVTAKKKRKNIWDKIKNGVYTYQVSSVQKEGWTPGNIRLSWYKRVQHQKKKRKNNLVSAGLISKSQLKWHRLFKQDVINATSLNRLSHCTQRVSSLLFASFLLLFFFFVKKFSNSLLLGRKLPKILFELYSWRTQFSVFKCDWQTCSSTCN